MTDNRCLEIRDQIMYYIDNELSDDNKKWILDHINDCLDCQQYLDAEQDIKSKICKKIKDAYVCRCDVQRIKESIQDKINNILAK